MEKQMEREMETGVYRDVQAPRGGPVRGKFSANRARSKSPSRSIPGPAWITTPSDPTKHKLMKGGPSLVPQRQHQSMSMTP